MMKTLFSPARRQPQAQPEPQRQPQIQPQIQPQSQPQSQSAPEPAAPLAIATLPAAITLRDVTVAYRGHPAVHHVSGQFAPGSTTAVVGPNGAGKSSLLAAVMGRLPLAQGQVQLAPGLAGRIAWLPQQHDVDRSFPISVQDLVAMGHWRVLGSLRGLGGPQRQAVQQALAAVGLAGFERRIIGELSAGQFQRALFARVLLQDAPAILLDEPFNALDARTTADLLAVVHRWQAQGRTVIAVLHDLEQVRQHFAHTLLLARRCVAWGPTAQALKAEHLFAARQMAEAWDESAPSCSVEDSALAGAGGVAPHDHLHGHAHEHAHGHAHPHHSPPPHRAAA